MRRLVSTVSVVAVYSACTFGNLANYTVTACNAGGSPNEQYGDAGGSIPDPCNVLNQADPTSCTPWQCDVTTSTCVQKMRDDDHDGDPPIVCGGADCDDTDPELNSLKVYPSTSVGSFSGGQVTPTLSYDGVTPVVAVVSDTACLYVDNTEGVATIAPNAGCTESPELANGGGSADPEQPYGDIDSSGDVASAYVALTGCPGGQLGFAYVANGSSEEDSLASSCPSTGTALPAVALLSGGQAAVAYYAATPLGDPLMNCSSAVAAPLNIATVTNLGSPSEQGFAPSPVTLTTGATAVRPPAVSWQSPTLFVASPDGSSATIWALTGQPLAMTASQSLSALTGARGVSVGARTNSNRTMSLAIVAELGCTPQAIHVEVVDYDPKAKTFTVVGDAQLAAQGTGFQTTPTVTWSALRNHWLTTWVVEAGPQVMGRFFDDTVKPSEDAFAVPGSAFAGQALANAHAVVVSPSDQVSDSKLRCP